MSFIIFNVNCNFLKIREAEIVFIMNDRNRVNDDGDTWLHQVLQGAEDRECLDFFLTHGTNVHLRNKKGRSVIHDAVKYYHLAIPAVDLLLDYGVTINAVDDQGANALHDALKNPLVTLQTIKKLLEYGVHPDHRDEENSPPLAYCESSSLLPVEKELAAKLLIQYTVLKKLDSDKREQLERGRGLVEGDEILCLHFCKDATKRNEWATFRDSCIFDSISMASLSLGNKNLLTLVTNHCFKRADKSTDIFPVKKVLSRLARNKYSAFRDIIISVIEECDFDLLVNELEISVMEYNSSCKSRQTPLFLNSDVILKITRFLSKVDLINLNLTVL